MHELRQQIDGVNHQILLLLAKRQELVLKIADHKKAVRLPARDKNREKEMMDIILKEAEALGLSPDFAATVFENIFEEGRRLQA